MPKHDIYQIVKKVEIESNGKYKRAISPFIKKYEMVFPDKHVKSDEYFAIDIARSVDQKTRKGTRKVYFIVKDACWLFMEGNYINDKRDGCFTYYTINEECPIVNGIRIDKKITYREGKRTDLIRMPSRQPQCFGMLK